MMHRTTYIFACLTVCTVATTHAVFFNSMPYELVVNKKYTLQTPQQLFLENLDGNISITQGNQKTITVAATKRTAKEDDLPEIEIIDEVKANAVHLRTKHDKDIRAAVDYAISMPADMALHITTGDGTITVQQIKGKITAVTKNGDIQLNGTKGVVEATTKKTGSIEITQPTGPVHLTTNKGSITINNARESVIADTTNGDIDVYCEKVPAKSKLKLTAASGSINVHLPHNTNAELRAKTEKGSLISKHLVTIKPFTTPLDSSAWDKFKKEVHGTLGTGEASINLYAQNGSIKILDYA